MQASAARVMCCEARVCVLSPRFAPPFARYLRQMATEIGLQACDIHLVYQKVDRAMLHIEFVDALHYNVYMPRGEAEQGPFTTGVVQQVEEISDPKFKDFLFKGLDKDNGCVAALRLLHLTCCTACLLYY